MIQKITTLLAVILVVTACGSVSSTAPASWDVSPVDPKPVFTKSPQAIATITNTPFGDSAPTLVPVQALLVTHGDRSQPYVALTFDLCQLPNSPSGFEDQIADILEQYHVPATFFLGGDWMRTHPEETRRLAADSLFELGNHSWSHPDFREAGWRKIGEELVMTQDMLYQLTGRQAHLFRLPYGYYNAEVLSVVAGHGLHVIQWDVESGDADQDFDAAKIQWAVEETVQNGSIIILHANGYGWHTAEALPGIIDYLRAQGYILVTVSQLIGLEPIP